MASITKSLDVNALLYDNKRILSKLIKRGDIAGLEQVMTIPGFEFKDHGLINLAPSKKMLDFLLKHLVDLNEAPNISLVKDIVNFILSDTLKYKINPNRLIIGLPLWMFMYINSNDIDIVRYKGDNFSEPLNINAVDSNGYTYSHKYAPSKEYLELKPDLTIKHNGLTVLEYKQKYNMPLGYLSEYVAPKSVEPDLAAQVAKLTKQCEEYKNELEKSRVLQEKADELQNELKKILSTHA